LARDDDDDTDDDDDDDHALDFVARARARGDR
jgi:hypothetical protein